MKYLVYKEDSLPPAIHETFYSCIFKLNIAETNTWKIATLIIDKSVCQPYRHTSQSAKEQEGIIASIDRSRLITQYCQERTHIINMYHSNAMECKVGVILIF